ncbi:MAG: hypothetical protein ABIC95_02585 [archaeon]
MSPAMGYQIVKYCLRCRKRFLVKSGNSKLRYCPDCEGIVIKEREAAAAESTD